VFQLALPPALLAWHTGDSQPLAVLSSSRHGMSPEMPSQLAQTAVITIPIFICMTKPPAVALCLPSLLRLQ